MKIAGTYQEKPPVEISKPVEEPDNEAQIVYPEGLNAKQKKNYRKKMQRLRKKQQKNAKNDETQQEESPSA